MKHRVLSIALALAAILPVPAMAAGSDAPNDLGTVGAIELQKTAVCLVDRSPRLGVKLLTLQPKSRSEAKLWRYLRSSLEKCLTGYVDSMNVGMIELRGFVAETLYTRNFPVDPDFDKLVHAEVPLPTDWDLTTKDQDVIVGTYMLEFGSCIAANDPKGVATLLRTGVRTSQEKAAVNQLRPSMGKCLLQGKTFRVDVAILRALTAQGLYRSIRHWQNPTTAAEPKADA